MRSSWEVVAATEMTAVWVFGVCRDVVDSRRVQGLNESSVVLSGLEIAIIVSLVRCVRE